MKVGPSVFTRMPCGPSSIAIALVMPSSAHFDAQYTVRSGPPTWPICDEMLINEPGLPAATSRRATACATKNAARTLSAMTAS